MAVAQCSHLSFFSLPLLKKQPLILSLSSISTPIPTRRRRRNHLRQKLLKTLTKPYPNSITPVETHRIEKFYENIEPEDVTFTQENAEIGGVYSVIKGHFGKYWYFKLGLYLVGILVFQTVCAVWVFGFDDIVQKNEEKDSIFERGSSEKSSLLLNKNEILGTSNMEEKLGEIRAMARKVRERERLKSLADEEEGGVFKSEIEKEVDRRLLTIQKKLDGIVKMPVFPLRDDDDFEEKTKNEPLMNKKKYKFKEGTSGSLSDKPKGFTGTKDYRVSKMEAMQNKFEDENGSRESASTIGATQEASLKRSDVSDKSTSIVEGERLKGKAAQWWQSLPYVVAVMMGRGRHDDEGLMGLFTLKASPYANKDGDLSHIVAFEDRGDATNLCYILESFFEDLGDFRADIVPLSVKDLAEEVKTHSKKVVVVKKRQLKLYAGQPLAEVETALRSLVE